MVLKVAGSFSGTGGIELGFQQAGFEVVWANEMDKWAHKTYEANFGAEHLDKRDIWEVNPEEIPDHDVWVSGFPCQPFSQAGAQLGLADKRGTLFEAIARILAVKQPQAFLLENVKGLVGHDGGRTLRIIIETLEGVGYSVDYRVMDAAKYGNVPQGRERIYLVGFRNGAIAWPTPIPLTSTVASVLGESPDAKYFYDERYGHISEKVKAAVVDDAVYQWRYTYARRNQSNVAPTLTANMGGGGHNVPIILDPDLLAPRRFTPRECFNLQGYPSDFVLPAIADGHLYKQAGNAVAVPVVKRVAEAIARELIAQNTMKEAA